LNINGQERLRLYGASEKWRGDSALLTWSKCGFEMALYRPQLICKGASFPPRLGPYAALGEKPIVRHTD
jgi:hypothetical protein